MEILVRRGKIDPILIDNKAVDVKFTSPLARSQDMEDVMNVRQAVEFVNQTAGPDAMALSFKTEDFGSWSAEKMGVPAELIRSKSEKIELSEAAVQAEAVGSEVKSAEVAV